MRIRKNAEVGLFVIGLLCMSFSGSAQRQIENIDRGLLAIKKGEGVYLSWRVLGDEYLNTSYNLYRGSIKLNTEPIKGATSFYDATGTTGVEYSVSAIVDGVEQEKSAPDTAWHNNYKSIPIQKPDGGITPDGVSYTYKAQEISIGDLNGDGKHELILKWTPTNEKDNSHSGYTGKVYLDAYEMDGTKLWRIDLGINIRAGSHYTQVMVYDLDGDGKAEVACKTADGTIDGTGAVIGDASKDYRSTSGNTMGKILAGPEFLTVFNGETGAAMATTDYIPSRSSSSWGDNYGNRVDRFLACIAYLDGVHPSLVMCRGYYTRSVLAAWDWKDGSLTSRWVFDTKNGYPDYEGQGNHQVSVADVDEDGKDEIIYGAMAVDDDGSPLWNTGLHHGDAMHVSDIDPNHPGLEKWGIHEGSGIGSALVGARTGEVLWHTAPGDVGRGVSADLVATYPGMECWGGTGGLRTATGEYAGENPSSSNFVIWWDGDDLRELLNHNQISKYGEGSLLLAYGCVSNNGTKGTPAISGDLLGDWREEVIWSTADNNYLRLYASTSLTNRRLFTLLHDPQYRLSLAWQNVAYNQPPHTSFFLGHGMADPPPPPIVRAKLKWTTGSTWDLSSNNWSQDGTPAAFQNGDDVLFDLTGSGTGTISITGDLNPSKVTVYAPQDYTLDGPGSLTGEMGILKAGAGSLTLNSDHDFTGKTDIWQGSLFINGNHNQSPVSVHNDASAGGSGTFGKGLTLHEKGKLIIGTGIGHADTLIIKDSLYIEGTSTLYFDLSDDSSGLLKTNDILIIQGDLILSENTILEIKLLDGSLETGQYSLIQYSGSFEGDANSISCTGLKGIPYKLIDNGEALLLEVIKLRDPGSIVWKGGSSNDWDLAGQLNWLNNGTPDWFVPGDSVIFNDSASPNTTVNVVESLYTGQILMDASIDYTLEGNGVISGTGGLIKQGSGILDISGNHDFTGSVNINEGTLKIEGLKNGGKPSALGASSSDPSNLVLNGGTLRLTKSSVSDRGMSIDSKGGTLSLTGTSSGLTLKGSITGDGQFKKIGNGDLTLSAISDWSGGLLIEDGTVILGSEEANIGGLGSGKVILKNATLTMFNNNNSDTDNCDFDLVIPQGSNSWLYLDGRSSLIGSLEGSGTLNLVTPFVRSELDVDWSAFMGRILVSTDAQDATFLVGNQNGFEKAAIELSDDVAIVYLNSEDASIKIGELSGTATSELGAGGQVSNTITWIIGDRNTNAEFHGLISNRQFKNNGAKTSVIKNGSGNWTLTHANTYSGITEVRGGILNIENTSGSATGSGDVFVRTGGALRGNGSIAGKLTIENEASVSMGRGSELGNFTVNNDVEFQPNSYLSVKLNTIDKTADKLVVKGHLSLDGILYITNNDGGSFALSDSYKILEADSISGNIKTILPVSPGEGLAWDTTYLREYGFLSISNAKEETVGVTDIIYPFRFSIYPNPGKGIVRLSGFSFPSDAGKILLNCYDQQGIQVFKKNLKSEAIENSIKVDVRGWSPGIYLFEISGEKKRYVQSFIKQ